MMTVNEFCTANNITLEAYQTDRRTDIPQDDWHKNAFHWNCGLRCGNKIYAVEYSVGRAHSTTRWRSDGERIVTPKPPKASDLLSSLVSDAREFADIDTTPTFKEWAGDLGYSDDSIKALEIYNHCRDTAIKLSRFLPGGLRNFIENVELD